MEEKIMDSYTYPGLSCQKQFHADLIDKFAKEANDFERHSTTLSIAALFLIEGTVNVH